jgi:4-amino-4-deoxy-L-arabinose transferase-like glycosyltransferase
LQSFDDAACAFYNIHMLGKWTGKSWLVNLFVGLLIILFGILYYGTLIRVPFHPDESTYIYMSSDFKQFLEKPGVLAYNPALQRDDKQRYRLIDPPLTRYWIGAALSVSGIDSLAEDWDWTLSWEKNLARGAFPDEKTLAVSRLSVSSLYLVALFAIFRSGSLLHGKLTGIMAIIFMGTNALVLLHTRRAMEEALLLPAVCLCLWSFFYINKRPWAAGLVVLMAINVKWSCLPLYLIGVLAIFLLDDHRFKKLSTSFVNLAIFTAVIAAGSYLLNPVAWADPWVAIRQAMVERGDLVRAQLASLQQIDPGLALTSPAKRLAGLLTHTFFSYPTALDIGNYRVELSSDIDAYTTSFGTTLFRGFIPGLISLSLTLFGGLLMLLRVLKTKGQPVPYRVVILAGACIFIISMIAVISLPFQRYVIPILPFVVLLSSFGISQVILPDKKAPA